MTFSSSPSQGQRLLSVGVTVHWGVGLTERGTCFSGKAVWEQRSSSGWDQPSPAIWGRLMTRRLGAWRYKYLEKKICFSKIWKRSTGPARNDRVRERGAWVRVRVRVCVSVNSYTGWTVILWNLFFSPQFATVPQMFSHTHTHTPSVLCVAVVELHSKRVWMTYCSPRLIGYNSKLCFAHVCLQAEETQQNQELTLVCWHRLFFKRPVVLCSSAVVA